MPDQKLIEFIIEARKRGFEDWQIRQPLIKKGWPKKEIEEAFDSLRCKNYKKVNIKNAITIYLDDDLTKIIEKRAKKNMFTISEQIDDILRTSALPQPVKEKIPL